MIIDPDFLDHWRTRMLVDALGGDEMAPFYVMRLWAHCQTRRSDRFDVPSAGLKGICRANGHDHEKLEHALKDAGFISRENMTIIVEKWAEKNASLIAAWDNGAKGGRPRKNPEETHGLPVANPSLTHVEPIREEKIREELLSVPNGTEVGASANRCPTKQIVDLYHEVLPTLSRVEKITTARQGYIRQRWLNDLTTLDEWRNYFQDVKASDFLMGRVNGSGDKPPFRADLEWLCRPGNFAKVAEGKYHRRTNGSGH